MSFTQEVLQRFNATHNSTFNLITEEILFGLPTATDVNKEKTKLRSAVSALLHLQKKTPEYVIINLWLYKYI